MAEESGAPDLAEHVEIVRGQFEATNRRDFTTAMDAYAEEVVLVVAPDLAPLNAGTFRGREAVGDWFGDWFRSFAGDYRFDIEEAFAVAERVFVFARHHGRGRASGVALDWSVFYVYTVRAGKVTRVEMYADRADALEAVDPAG
jgi:uncharacterized protein